MLRIEVIQGEWMVGMDVKQFSSNKILWHLDRVNELLQTGYTPPITAELDMTNICNHKCPSCFGFLYKDKSCIVPEDAKRIIGQLADMGVKAVTFTGGGEPLCNTDTLDAVKYANHKGLDTALITNGSLLNAEAVEAVLANCVWVRISLDAASAETYKRTHGMGEEEFLKVLKNIRLLAEYKVKTKSACTVGVGYLTSQETEEEIIPMAKLIGEQNEMCGFGIDYLQYRPLLKSHSNRVYYNNRSILDTISEAASYSTGNFEILCSLHKYRLIKDGRLEKTYGKCLGHHFAAVIAADMKVYICCHLRGVEKYCIGNLKVSSFEDIWKSPERKKVYESIDLKKCPPLCRDDTFNTILWDLSQPKKHVNFL